MMRFPGVRTVVLATCLAIMTAGAGSAGAADRDQAESRSWLELSTRAGIARRVDATLSQNLRWSGMGDRLELFAPELSLRYRPRSWWRLEGGYRYERERDNDAAFQDRHRLFANTRLRTRTSRFTLQLRLQWQEEFRDEQDDGTPQRHVLRTRAKVAVRKLGAITPYASLEGFNRLDGDDDDVPSGTLTKLRCVLGAECDRGQMEYNARYLLVIPVHDDQDPLQHIVSVGVRFDLPR